MKSERIPVGVLGSSGRIGRLVCEVLKDHAQLSLGASLCSGNFLRFLQTDQAEMLRCQAWIDFSVPSASVSLARWLFDNPRPLLVGTTGHNSAERSELLQCAERMPLSLLPNTSRGIHALRQASKLVSQLLGQDFCVEIFELHHALKRDVPSGTALSVAQDLEDLRGESIKFSREGKRGRHEIGLAGLRGGDCPGEHTVFFLGPDERLEITHRAGNPRLFARGAVLALERLIVKPAGLYDARDILG